MRRMVQVFGILLLLLLMPFYSLADSLPRSIGPLRLEQLRSGDEARLEIDQLHGKAMSFQKGTKVIWLAVDASVAKETISDAIKKIP